MRFHEQTHITLVSADEGRTKGAGQMPFGSPFPAFMNVLVTFVVCNMKRERLGGAICDDWQCRAR